jgi:hypothetical protein
MFVILFMVQPKYNNTDGQWRGCNKPGQRGKVIVEKNANKRYNDAGNDAKKIKLVKNAHFPFIILLHLGGYPNGFYR